MIRKSSQSGNVFMAIFGAVAMVGIVGSGVMTFMKGPVQSAITANKLNNAQSQMTIAGEVAIMAATNSANKGDCDGDGYVEPPEWRDAGVLPKPVNGGLIPNSIGVSKKDPWGTDYGYCVWDHGDSVLTVGCQTASPGNNRRLGGTLSQAYPVIAIISAGPDRTFSTTCRNFATGADRADQNNNGVLTDAGDFLLVDKTAGTDDVIYTYSYEGAISASGGLWALKSSDNSTAYINKNIESQAATFSGIGHFDRIGATGSDFLSLVSGLKIPDASVVTTCNAAAKGVMRRGSSGTSLETCDGVSAWKAVSGSGGVIPGSLVTPASLSNSGSTPAVTQLDDFNDAATDSVDYIISAGLGAGAAKYGVGWGVNATQDLSSNAQSIVGFGYNAGAAIPDGAYEITAVGSQSLNASINDAWDLAFGAQAFGSGSLNGSSTAFGYQAGAKGGDYDMTAFGSQAMANNINGCTEVTAIGAFAFKNAPCPPWSVAFGYSAGLNSIDNDNSVYVGANAGLNNGEEDNPTVIGADALVNGSVWGDGQNSGIGYGILKNSRASGNNLAVGSRAGYNLMGGFNTVVGYRSLYNTRGGYENTAVGAFASENLILSPSTSFGFSANYGGATCATAIGYGAMLFNDWTDCTVAPVAVGSGAAKWMRGNDFIAVGYKAMGYTDADTLGYAAGGGGGSTSSYAVAIGSLALSKNSYTNNTVAFGASAAKNLGGSSNVFANTAVGVNAMSGILGGGVASPNDGVTSGLAGYWKFDETTGTSAADSSGSGNTGTLNNSPTWGSGKFSNALTFSQASSSNVTVPPSASLNNLGPLTICAWIKPTGSMAGNFIRVIGKLSSNPSTAYAGWGIYIDKQYGNLLSFYTRQYGWIETTSVMGTGTWQHACATWDGSDGIGGMKVYYNGSLASIQYSGDDSGTAYDLSSGGAYNDSSSPLYIGTTADTTQKFDGSIDDVRVYNRVLSAGEVSTIYSAASGIPGIQNTAVGYNAIAGGSDNTAVGHNAGAGTSGDKNVCVGVSSCYGAGAYTNSGSNNTMVGYNAGVTTTTTISNATAIGYNATVSASNTIRFGDTNVTAITGQVAFGTYSDRRVKKDIKPTDLGLDFIMKLKPVSYRLKNGNGRLDYGFIAQDIDQALEGRVTNMIIRADDKMRTYEFRSNDLLSPMVKAVQEQQKELEDLEKSLDLLGSK